MFRFFEIISNHNQTFYNYRTGRKKTRVPALLTNALISLILAVSFSKPSNELVNAIITAQAILAGFGFNVLFFLLAGSGGKERLDLPLEEKNRAIRLSKLHKELFYNVSYFNIVTIFSVFLALAVLFPPATETSLEVIRKIYIETKDYLGFKFDLKIFNIAVKSTQIIGLMILYGFIIESILTFLRTVSRVNFFFRIKIEGSGRQA